MSKNLTTARLVRNELLFRAANEKVHKGIKQFFSPKEQAETKLYFYCECADDQCKERIRITPKRYAALHKKTNRFVVLPGHEIDSIETTVLKKRGYLVVEKHVPLPKQK